MGYGVYEDREHARWAGYAVPALCDAPGCREEIDRGLAYKCEPREVYDEESDEYANGDGPSCGLFYCDKHGEHDAAHDLAAAGLWKPDSPEWLAHMLLDPSWEQWRTENPVRVAAALAAVAPFPEVLARRAVQAKDMEKNDA